jgi:serine/threonine-protein kinase
MGVVYRAFDTLLQRTVALKVIGGQIDSNPDTRARFLREARSAAQLSHKNIVTIYDLGEEDGHPFLAMEYLEGQDLQQRLCDPVKMSLARKLDVALDLCEGLEFAHSRGVVHRDVKPANIFITNAGNVKILDFGLARLITSQLTNSNMLMGTLNYIAPEQVRGDPADHRSDVFSVGVVIYELLGSKKAFEGDSFASTLYKILEEVPEPLWRVDATVPRALAAIVERALAKPLDQRFQSMAALHHELLRFRHQLLLAGSGAAAMPGGQVSSADEMTMIVPIPPAVGSGAVHHAEVSPSGPLSGPPRGLGSSWQIGAGAIVLLIVVTGAWFALHRSSSPTPERIGSAAVPQVATSSTLGRAEQALQSHDYAAAEQQATELLRQSPGDAGPQRVLERARAARAAIESAIQKARSSLAAGDFQSASRSAGDVLTLAPENAEARQIVEQGAARAASRSVADARLRMVRARDQARAAKAPALAAPAYGTATRAEQVAEQLAATGQTADATARFYEASGLYQSAATIAQTRAQERSEPDVPPASARPPAPPATSEAKHTDAPSPALPAGHPTAESQPALPPMTAPAPAPPAASLPEAAAASPSAEDGIGQLLAHYKAALEARDLDALKKLWPGLTTASANAIGAEFQNASRLTVGILDPRISASGANGTVTFRRWYEIQTRDGQKLRTETLTTMTVRRTSAGWVIESIRFSPAR